MKIYTSLASQARSLIRRGRRRRAARGLLVGGSNFLMRLMRLQHQAVSPGVVPDELRGVAIGSCEASAGWPAGAGLPITTACQAVCHFID